MRFIGLMLCGWMVACASTGPAQEGTAAEDLSTLEEECDERSVLALCSSGQCELFWCRAVAPYLAAGQPPRSPTGGWNSLPGSIGLHVGTAALRTQADTPLSGRIVKASGPRWLASPSVEGLRVFDERDVVQQLVRLQKPGDVAAWWSSGPKVHPDQWLHSLSHWEVEYLQAMTAPTVPAPLRMHPPVEPGKLTPQETREAAHWVGEGAAAEQKYAHFENRRRIVAHYVLTHPATIRLQVGLYGLVRDSNPLHFALERGWQVGRGKEMFTQTDVSRLGAAAEFFAALAVGVAVDKALDLAHPQATSNSSAPYMTPDVERAFVEAVRLRAAHLVEVLSLRERGPVLTGVLDTRTGRTFFGINQERPPDNLYPLLQQRLADYLKKTGGVTPERAGDPGAHSEIVALNRALYEREAVLGRPIEPQELSEFVLHNRSLRGATKIEGIPPPCPNCKAILPPGVEILP
ncbi:MAG: YwqJ-related putative deaminase [Hyalangium sp.]|uniref:YwqJ-related putative deaminase n=1 Tax=Hyalangium sp. TaxID=2028555 RepID=UPI003899AB1A